jgi:regulator of sigma E protease
MKPPPSAHPTSDSPPAKPEVAEVQDEPPAPTTFAGWVRENTMPLLFIAFLGGLIWYKGLNGWDILKVALGLGLVILVHELGHFLAAKWCDVHVETFSIFFGKPLPGLRFKYGETTYKIGWIPLGGYVKMVGEGESADSEEAEEDPRSFKNKSVGQRMLIISAGVIMNIILAGICFVAAYSHGVEEKPPVIGAVEAGSPSWQAGIHSGDIIKEIDRLKRPMFDDIRPIVMGSDKGEKVTLLVQDGPDGPVREVAVEPVRDADALYPTIGVVAAWKLTLAHGKRADFKPYVRGSAAEKAEPPFQPDDRVIGMSDPADPARVTETGPGGRPLDYFEYHRRLVLLRGKPIVIRVERNGSGSVDIRVPPEYTHVSGLVMQMGRIAAVRQGSGAANAKVIAPAGADAGVQPARPDVAGTGDMLIEVEVQGPNGKIQFVSHPTKAAEGVEQRTLDPLRLPFDLEEWADTVEKPGSVRLTLLRPSGHNETTRVTLDAEWDPSARAYIEAQMSLNAPLTIPELGLAYYVEGIVDEVRNMVPQSTQPSPAVQAGLQKGDIIKEARPKYLGEDGKEVKTGNWRELKTHQWATVFEQLQQSELKQIDLKVERGSGTTVEATLKLEADPTWPAADRGLLFQGDSVLHKADGLVDAMELGWHRTWRTVRVIYQNLYAMIFARVSPFTMSGPLTIASVSYSIAGENIWQFILFLGIINVNLAVINFLPIPALDGGHMALLLYEWIRGKPAPESLQFALQVLGIVLILGLMAFVIFLDVRRLFF